jgi:hypothetical protein
LGRLQILKQTETGVNDKTFAHPTIDLNNPENLSLTIEMGFSDFSACVYNQIHREICYAETFSFTTLNDLKEKSKVLSMKFNDVEILLFNTLFTCIPNAIKEEQSNEKFLQFNCGEMPKNHSVKAEEVNALLCSILYYTNTDVVDFFSEQFKHAQFSHVAKRFLEFTMNSSNYDLNVHVYNNHILISYFKDGHLTFINSLEYQHHNDFIYLLLFTCKELGLTQHDTTIKLSGFYNISLENALQNYFKDVYGHRSETNTSSIIPLSFTPYFALSSNY